MIFFEDHKVDLVYRNIRIIIVWIAEYDSKNAPSVWVKPLLHWIRIFKASATIAGANKNVQPKGTWRYESIHLQKEVIRSQMFKNMTSNISTSLRTLSIFLSCHTPNSMMPTQFTKFTWNTIFFPNSNYQHFSSVSFIKFIYLSIDRYKNHIF